MGAELKSLSMSLSVGLDGCLSTTFFLMLQTTSLPASQGFTARVLENWLRRDVEAEAKSPLKNVAVVMPSSQSNPPPSSDKSSTSVAVAVDPEVAIDAISI